MVSAGPNGAIGFMQYVISRGLHHEWTSGSGRHCDRDPLQLWPQRLIEVFLSLLDNVRVQILCREISASTTEQESLNAQHYASHHQLTGGFVNVARGFEPIPMEPPLPSAGVLLAPCSLLLHECSVRLRDRCSRALRLVAFLRTSFPRVPDRRR